jgi:Ras-related protein Rab-4B
MPTSLTPTESYDCLLKFIIIGDSGTGKSCILQNFLGGRFEKDSLHTVGVEFASKVVDIGKKRIKLQIWDTAGQERFR